MIFELTVSDLPELASIIASEAAPAMHTHEPANEDFIIKFWTGLIDRKLSLSLLDRGSVSGDIRGWLLGLQGQDWMSGNPVAIEQFWFVRKDKGGGPVTAIRLMEQFIANAKRRGCTAVCAGDWARRPDHDLASIYGRMGFEPMERYFRKEI